MCVCVCVCVLTSWCTVKVTQSEIPQWKLMSEITVISPVLLPHAFTLTHTTNLLIMKNKHSCLWNNVTHFHLHSPFLQNKTHVTENDANRVFAVTWWSVKLRCWAGSEEHRWEFYRNGGLDWLIQHRDDQYHISLSPADLLPHGSPLYSNKSLYFFRFYPHV